MGRLTALAPTSYHFGGLAINICVLGFDPMHQVPRAIFVIGRADCAEVGVTALRPELPCNLQRCEDLTSAPGDYSNFCASIRSQAVL